MRHHIAGTAVCLLACLLFTTAGCSDATLKAQQQQVLQQQQQIEQQQQELEALKNQTQSSYTPGVASPGGGCDRATEQTATQHGGEKFAVGDYQKALGYYKDALMACSSDPRAEMNVARTDEALGDRQSAIEHFRAVASSGDPGASDEARNALVRLGAQ
jgi:tetratricopeptide (TPR) repeat protein